MKVNDLLNIAFEVSELNRDLALSKSRQKDHVKIRQLIVYFIKQNFKGLTLETIGDYVGYKHDSVLYSIKEVKLLEFHDWQPYLEWKIKIQDKIDLFYNNKLDIKICKYSQVFKI